MEQLAREVIENKNARDEIDTAELRNQAPGDMEVS